jgi:hypothetical protein
MKNGIVLGIILLTFLGCSSPTESPQLPLPELEAPTNLVATVFSLSQIDLIWNDNIHHST